MRGRIIGHGFTWDGRYQVYGFEGHRKYVIRQYRPRNWWAIQLFGAVGCIAGEGESPEEALKNAERSLIKCQRQMLR